MTPNGFGEALATALARARERAFAVIAADLPADVRVRREDGRLALRGRGLAMRAIVDGRLRDFVGQVRAGVRR